MAVYRAEPRGLKRHNMTQQRSINQRLNRAGSLTVKKEIALDWAISWRNEQSELMRKLGQAVKDDDFDALCIITGQLKAVTDKRFTALPNVIEHLTKPNA